MSENRPARQRLQSFLKYCPVSIWHQHPVCFHAYWGILSSLLIGKWQSSSLSIVLKLRQCFIVVVGVAIAAACFHTCCTSPFPLVWGLSQFICPQGWLIWYTTVLHWILNSFFSQIGVQTSSFGPSSADPWIKVQACSHWEIMPHLIKAAICPSMLKDYTAPVKGCSLSFTATMLQCNQGCPFRVQWVCYVCYVGYLCAGAVWQSSLMITFAAVH